MCVGESSGRSKSTAESTKQIAMSAIRASGLQWATYVAEGPGAKVPIVISIC